MAKQSFQFEPFSIILFIITVPWFNLSLCCPPYQKEALLQFKFLLLGNVSSNSNMELSGLESWNSTSDCCHWERVRCHNSQKVTSLDLFHLTPSLAMKTLVKSDVLAPLFHLQTLIFLDISYNGHIQGEIPGVGLANLTNLVRLYMAGNSLIGSLPPQLFSLRRLEYLDVSYNFHGGNVPAQIGNLTNLKFFSLYSNKVSGAIPPSLMHLTRLEYLDLGHNFFTMEIPTDIGNLSNISYLSLRENNFSGEIPPSIQKMEELEVADLCDNNLEGTLPQWLADTDIKYLLLSNNKFSGSLPPHLFQSQSFLALILSYNNLSGALPETIGEASRMKILILSSNRFFGTVPPSISKLGLRLLDLSCNKFSGNEFPIFNPNSSLAYIDFSFNKLSGEVPVTFPLVVIVLLLNENEFSGVLPQEIAKFSQLQYLNLQSNNIGGEIPNFLSQMSSLLILNLRNNSFNGSIPISLSNLSALQILDLSYNNLSGKIPLGFGNLTGMINNHDVPAKPFGQIPFPSSIAMARHVNRTSFWDAKFHILRNLEVFWKKFEQGLPIQNIQIYTFLDLSNNQLSGEIPDSLGRLKSLKSLNLSNNNFFGGIPWSFGGLQRIESLDLSHNNFSGEIPHTFGNLLQLSNLDLSNNKLEGRIPGGSQMDRMNDPNSYANNSGLCGMQIKLPCEEIPSKPKQVKEKMVKKSKSSETWFSWKMVVIGYPFGFLSIILALYVTDYFYIA